MNVRVDLDSPIRDGMEVVFKAPCDASEVTGLNLYYPVEGVLESQNFAFADANTNDLGHLDALFAKDAVVKVILDLDTNMAFVQNADTNAYLESRFEDTINKLCPDFSKTGAAVRCEPVEGYPLEVVASEEATQIIRCGKNIFDIATAGVYHNNTHSNYWCDMYVTETGFRLESNKTGTNDWSYFGFCLGTVKELAGKTITVSAKASTSITSVQLPWLNISTIDGMPTSVRNNPTYEDGGYSASKKKTLLSSDSHDGYATATYTITGEEEYSYIAILFQYTYGGSFNVGDWTEWSDIQVELGDTATAYESYRSDTFAPNEPITASKGVNTLYADNGVITVKGKADPVVITENLSKSIPGKYELIEDITLEETVAEFRRNTEPNGSAYNFTAVRIIVDALASTSAENLSVVMYNDNAYLRTLLQTNIGSGINTSARCTYFKCYNDCGFLESMYASTTSGSNTQLYRRLVSLDTVWKNIKSIDLHSKANIPAGSRIRIYAIRG